MMEVDPIYVSSEKLSTHQVCVSLSLQSLINRFESKNFLGGEGEYLNTSTALLLTNFQTPSS